MDVSRAKKKLEASLKRVKELPKEQAEPILKFHQKCIKATESDVEQLIYEINNNSKYKDSTKALYRITLKKFYGYPWINTSLKRHKKELPELVCEEEALNICACWDQLG